MNGKVVLKYLLAAKGNATTLHLPSPFNRRKRSTPPVALTMLYGFEQLEHNFTFLLFRWTIIKKKSYVHFTPSLAFNHAIEIIGEFYDGLRKNQVVWNFEGKRNTSIVCTTVKQFVCDYFTSKILNCMKKNSLKWKFSPSEKNVQYFCTQKRIDRVTSDTMLSVSVKCLNYYI